MYKDVINQVSISTVWDVRQAKKDGSHPIRIQVYFQRKQKYYNTGKDLTKSDWDRLPTTRVPELVKTRNCIRESFDLVQRSVKTLVYNGEFTFAALEVLLGKVSAGSLNDGFRSKMETLKNETRIGSYNYYQCTIKSIENFAGPLIPFENVTVDWLKRYEKWLLDNGKSYTTVYLRMRAIRTIINIAHKSGMIKSNQYPFGKGKYEIRKTVTVKRALSMKQIAAIANYDKGTTTTEYYRDLWVFLFLCNGIGVADLVNLKFKNIQDGEICFIRQKTRRTSSEIKEIHAVMTPEMQRTIDRWGNDPSPEEYLFPLIRHYDDPILHYKEVAFFIRQFNKQLKIIGKNLGISKLTTYSARHSYATTLKRSGVSIAFISENLGHSEITTTKSYLDSFEKEERVKNIDFLRKALKV